MSDMSGTPVPEEPASAAEAQAPDLATLTAKLADAEARAAAARDAQLRAIADLDNVRKRTEREVQSARQYGAEKLLGELLGVADSLDLGLAAAAKPEAQVSALVEGLQLTQKQLLSTLEKHGVKAVDPRGEPFNPEFHEAVTMVPSADVPPNHVLNVMQKGYRLHERLLRPAMVVVARAPVEPSQEAAPEAPAGS
jgi:molecular chaperone GrpE